MPRLSVPLTRPPERARGDPSGNLAELLHRAGTVGCQDASVPDLTALPTPAPAGPNPKPKAAEFFGGIGLARLGLESAGFDVVWTNEISRDKHLMYAGHFGGPAGHIGEPPAHAGDPKTHTFVLGDVADVTGADLPKPLALSWASSPCTDVSLAGDRAGLDGDESGTFWHWTRVLDEMGDDRPPVVVLENVEGLATSHSGEDIAAAVAELNQLGYSVDAVALDARRFVPQSRGRLFVIGALDPPDDEPVPNSELRPDWLQGVFGDTSLRTHRAALPPPPPPMISGLHAVMEPMKPADPRWWDAGRVEAFVNSLSPTQAARLHTLRTAKTTTYRTAYRRTRNGSAVWEIRPDDISGCLRTARGGSSKQAVVQVGNGKVRVRWMTPREYARLMGAGDYTLDGVRTNQALFGFGDAVCVPAVAWLAEHYLMPLVTGELQDRSKPARSITLVHG